MLSREICSKCRHSFHTYPEATTWMCDRLADETYDDFPYVTGESCPPDSCPKLFEQSVAAGMRETANVCSPGEANAQS
jgi:hypothetical protein